MKKSFFIFIQLIFVFNLHAGTVKIYTLMENETILKTYIVKGVNDKIFTLLVVKKGNEIFYCINNEKYGPYEDINFEGSEYGDNYPFYFIPYSKDGNDELYMKNWIFIGKENGNAFYCYANGIKSGPYQFVSIVKTESCYEKNKSVFIARKKLSYYPSVADLRLRESPGTDGKIIRILGSTEKLEYLKTGKKDYIDKIQGNWIFVKTPKGERGWCFNGYLQFEKGDFDYAVIDGKEYGPYEIDYTGIDEVYFSGNGKSWIFACRKNGKPYIIINGVETGLF